MKKILFLFVAVLCFGSWATASDLTFEKVGDFAWVNQGAIVAIDIHGDGYQSVLYMERASDKRSVFLENNKGTLTKKEYGAEEGLKDLGIAFHENPGMVVMDVNKDGKQDVVVAGGWPPAVNVYLNNGAGAFTKDEKQTNLIGARDYDNSDYLAAGDYDNDGWEDLFVLGLTNEDKALQLSIYRNNNGVFELAQSLEGCRGGSIAVGDVNGDNNLDVFYNGYGSSDYVTNLYYGDGKGNWTKAEGIDFVKSNKGDVAIIDFNGDGKMDLLEQSREVQNTTIYCNNGDGTFTKKSNEETGLPKRDDLYISYGDFNADGKMDIIASHWEIGSNKEGVALYINNGDFTFTKVDLENEARGAGVFAWDYDNDKKCDYMVWNYSDSKSWNAPIVRNTTVIEEPTPEEPTYEIYEVEIKDLAIDLDNLALIGSANGQFQVAVNLFLGEYNRNEDTYQLIPESYVEINGTEATFVEGYASVNTFDQTATAVVRCVWNGMNIELHLTMSAAPLEATKVVVENATVEIEKYLIVGDMYDYALKMTGEWINPEDGLTYPVLVEVPVYYPESTEPSEITSTVTVGGWGDNDPWLGFGEGTLTITTVGDVVTATGVVQNPMAGIAIDITISGSITPTGLEDATVTVKSVKMIKNGQLIINQNGREFNVQGAQL